MAKLVNTKPRARRKKEQNKESVNMSAQEEAMKFYMSAEKHISDIFLRKFADDQLQYFCDNDNAKYINEYYLTRGVHRKLYNEWTERSDYFRNRHDMCLEIIGLRRERAMEKCSALVLKLRQYQYDPGYGEAEARDAELKKRDNEKKMGDIKVFLPTNEKVIDRDKFKPIQVGCDDGETDGK